MHKLKLILVVFILLVIPNALSIGLSPPRYVFDFEPNFEEEVVFTIYNTQDVDIIAHMSLLDNADQFVTIQTNRIPIKARDSVDVKFKIKLPASLPPGEHKFYWDVTESSASDAPISAVTAVSTYIMVNVPYPGEYLTATITAPNVRVGESVPINIKVDNDGTDITGVSKGVLSVSGNAIIDLIPVTFSNIPSKGTINKTIYWNTTESMVGEYRTKIVIDYKDGTTSADTDFKVGDLLINILDVIPEKVAPGERAKVDIIVTSKWNDPIDDVFVELSFNDQVVRTNSNSVPSWDAKTFVAYLETEGLEVGNYKGTATVYYADKTDTKDFVLVIKKPINIHMVVNVIAIAAAIIILVMYVITKKPKVLPNYQKKVYRK